MINGPQKLMLSVLLVAGLQFLLAAAQAQENSDDGFTDELSITAAPATELPMVDREVVEDLENRIKALEENFQKQSESIAAGKDKKKDDSAKDAGKESTAKWNVKLGGHVQLDYVNWADSSPSIPDAQDFFEFRRLRLVADGTGYEVLDFRLQMTLEPETVGDTQPPGLVMSPDVKDAYLSVNDIPTLGRFRIGNFFVPFSLEQVTNDTNNLFMERSIPSQGVFSPDREVGMAFYNATPDRNATISYGIFLDSISEGLKEKIDDNQGMRLSARATWLPFYDEASQGRYLWHTGVGILHTDDQDGRVRFRSRPQIHEGPRIIDSGTTLAEHYTTGNIESAIVWGALSLQSEAFLSSVDRSVEDRTEIGGVYVYLSYFLTGENRIYDRFGQHAAQFARNVPRRNLFQGPGSFGPGAWEFKTRWSYLDLNNLDGGQYNDLTVGFNWYWTDRTRVMFDWIHPITTEDSVFGQTTADILAMRFDFNW
jgi:phosphate-selective porin OprO and OprP